MGALSQKENEWLDKATAAAVAGARKIALNSQPLMNTPVGRLSDHEWGMICTAVIFGWIEVRVQQAISEGRDQEQIVRLTGLSPSPCDVAVVRSILPALADKAGIDWAPASFMCTAAGGFRKAILRDNPSSWQCGRNSRVWVGLRTVTSGSTIAGLEAIQTKLAPWQEN
jgi:hypothetical protein